MMAVEVKNNKGVLVLNRHTERSVSNTGFIVIDMSDRKKMFIRVSRGAVSMMSINLYERLEFVKIGDEWFVCCTSLQRGYKCSKVGLDRRVTSHIAVRVFSDFVKYPFYKIKLRIKKTNLELNAMPLFKIDFSNLIPVNNLH